MLTATRPLRSASGVAFFKTPASDIKTYARVAEGVDLDRAPALVVLRTKPLTKGSIPEATVSYGFKSVESMVQELRDTNYKGPTDLPTYPTG